MARTVGRRRLKANISIPNIERRIEHRTLGPGMSLNPTGFHSVDSLPIFFARPKAVKAAKTLLEKRGGFIIIRKRSRAPFNRGSSWTIFHRPGPRPRVIK